MLFERKKVHASTSSIKTAPKLYFEIYAKANNMMPIYANNNDARWWLSLLICCNDNNKRAKTRIITTHTNEEVNRHRETVAIVKRTRKRSIILLNYPITLLAQILPHASK
jgi:hypothetical protein